MNSSEARAVQFLARVVPEWSKENGCFSCHHNGDGVRALYAARIRGYHVPIGALTDSTSWAGTPERWDHNKGEPGFNDRRLATLQFGSTLLAALETRQLTDRRLLVEVARRVLAEQASDGSWPIEPQNPVGSPATHGSVLASFLAWRILQSAGASEFDGAKQKAADWLARIIPRNTPAAAVVLFAAREIDHHEFPVAGALNLLHSGQTAAGGWGPYSGTPPEAFDTALALLAMAQSPRTPESIGILRRGRAFLKSEQNDDGSWPATTRPSGGTSYAQRVATTAWALQALLSTSDVEP